MKKSLSAFALLATITGFCLTTQPAGAQEYAPGQGVEVDITGINNWEGGTVVPFLPGDSQDGYQVRVKVPRYSLYPDGFMVQKIHMRPGAAPAAPAAAQQQQQPPAQQAHAAPPAANHIPKTWEPVHNPRPFENAFAAQPAHQAPAPQAPNQGQAGQLKFKAGDAVEIDGAKINVWEAATVLPFEGNDPRDGSFYRIRINKYTITPHGMLVPAESLRAAAGGGGAKVANRNIGDRVDAQSNGKWHLATIVDKKGIDEYKVHYDGWDAKWDEWVDPTRLKGPGQGGPARGDLNPVGGGMKKAANADAGMTPQLNNGVPNIPGTGWDMMSIGKRGEAPSVAKSFAQSFSFSKDGRWSVARYGLAAGQMGTYKVQGNKLIMTNSLNGEIFGNYTMNWKPGENMMELDDGKWILRMKHVSNNAY